MKTSFETRVSGIEPGSFVNIHIFCNEIFFLFSFSIFSIFVESLKSKLQNVKTPKRKRGSFVQRYSFKFRALGSIGCTVYRICCNAVMYGVIHEGWVMYRVTQEGWDFRNDCKDFIDMLSKISVHLSHWFLLFEFNLLIKQNQPLYF